MNKKKAGPVNEMRFGVRLVTTTAFALLAAITGPLMMVGCPQTPAPGTSFRDCSNGCPEMVVVPQGRFTMGAPAGEEARENLPIERRGRERRRRVTVAIIRRSSAATPMLVIWTIVSSILAIAG